MAHMGLTDEELPFAYDSSLQPYPWLRDSVWPMTTQHLQSNPPTGIDMQRHLSQVQNNQTTNYSPNEVNESHLMTNWAYSQAPSHYNYPPTSQSGTRFAEVYPMSLPTSPVDVVMPISQAPMSNDMSLANPYLATSQPLESMPLQWRDMHSSLPNFTGTSDTPLNVHGQTTYSASPTETHLEVRSLTSLSDSEGWAAIETRHPCERGGCIDPNDTVHNRTSSESSWSSENNQRYRASDLGSFELIPHAVQSPSSDSNPDFEHQMAHRQQPLVMDAAAQGPPIQVSPMALARPVPVPAGKAVSKPSSPETSPSSHLSTSPVSRRATQKSAMAKTTDKVVKRTGPSSRVDNEKRVGKRKGPLRPEQRKQASEIRKLRACLRCKFLKKTCDKGEPCAGCQPSHARLWQVPCTRVDIKDIGSFTKDYRADYARHLTLDMTHCNIRGFADKYRTIYISHGYGQMLPLTVHEVFVRDEKVFDVDWAETNNQTSTPKTYKRRTAPLHALEECLSTAKMSLYLDRHLDAPGSFHNFVDSYCGETPFLTQMLKTAFDYYSTTKAEVIRTALKFLLAYSLTLHITIVEGIPSEEEFLGRVDDGESQYHGKIVAPNAINFQVKHSMGILWRDLQQQVLKDLSGLYSSVYSGDKLKQWPTIFILATLLLAVWEYMQFDVHRTPNDAVVDKFLHEMETVPVGVVVGLFQAISQKLPSFTEWDTNKHHHLLQSNAAACTTMTEVRDNVARHGKCPGPDRYLVLAGAGMY